MTPERWQEVKQLFAAAVACAPDQRSAFLARECGADEELRREAERLLIAHENSTNFIETPAFEVAPEFLVDDPDALVGQQLGSYRIDAVLGVGGMGVVYLAYDERLGRKVALKLPPPSVAKEGRFEQLEREARTASALNHPNVMTIHEVGEVDGAHYIATEFIEGTTLRERMTKGPVPPNEALEIAIQVARALRAAHGAGIVHRDIKPENIMLRPDGYVKVLDFGIAKVTQYDALAAGVSNDAQLATQQGQIRGTTRYMSPEQARAQPADARSDLWSLGVVLYEMLSGRPAFEGATPTDVMAAVLLKDPPPLDDETRDVSLALRRVVERALRKDPAERFHTAEEMLAALRNANTETQDAGPPAGADGSAGSNRTRTKRWAGAATAAALLVGMALFYGWRERENKPARAQEGTEPSIAVLPFENLSTDTADAYFADGIQDDVLTSVGKIKDVKVIARASVMEYRGARRAGKIREIGESLNVSHVLEGSVRRNADRVAVNVALIDTRDERQVWSERYERTLTDSISLQGELAVEIARALQARLTPSEAAVAAARPTQNPEAYLLYLRARESETRTPAFEQPQTTIPLYQQAVDLDPNFALARARLSLCANAIGQYDQAPHWKGKARAEAEEALRLQPELGEARLALTHCYLWGDDDDERALRELTRAAELLPNSAEVPLTAAFIYKRQNKFRDRIAALQRAEALDPRNREVLARLTITYRWVRNWTEALHGMDRVTAIAPDAATYRWRWLRASDEFRLSGDVNALKSTVPASADAPASATDGWFNFARYEIAMLEHDYAEAERCLSAVPPETFRGEANLPMSAHPKDFHAALLAVARNSDPTAKQQALEIARQESEARVSSLGSAIGIDRPHADLALLDTFLGRKEEAIRALNAAIEPARPGIEKNELLSALALVYAHTGEPEKAINLIEHLLTVPIDLQRGAVYNMTLVDLKWRWQWDPLRSHPRFQKLLARPEPPTSY